MKRISKTEREFTYQGVTFRVVKQSKFDPSARFKKSDAWEVYACAEVDGSPVSYGAIQSHPATLGPGWFIHIGATPYAENYEAFREAVRRVARLCSPYLPRVPRWVIYQGSVFMGQVWAYTEDEAAQKYAGKRGSPRAIGAAQYRMAWQSEQENPYFVVQG